MSVILTAFCDYCEKHAEFDFKDGKKLIKKSDLGEPKCFKVTLDIDPIFGYYPLLPNSPQKSKDGDYIFCSKDCFIEYIKKNVNFDKKQDGPASINDLYKLAEQMLDEGTDYQPILDKGYAMTKDWDGKK